MQTTTTAQATSRPLIFARHVIGMGLIALANPLIYYDREPIGVWLMTCIGPLVGAMIVYGLYAVFFTDRAKRAWPKSFFLLAWVFLALILIGQWSDYNRARSTAKAAKSAAAASAPTTSPAAVTPTQPAATPPPAIEDDGSDRSAMIAAGIPGQQNVADIYQWADAKLRPLTTAQSLSSAHVFAAQWQKQFQAKTRMAPPQALFAGYNIVLDLLSQGKGVCYPDPDLDGGITMLDSEHLSYHPRCYPV